ncbi:MAG: hypothetical protein ACHQLQ_15670 [Candidatus Acidiferrales bacterium]
MQHPEHIVDSKSKAPGGLGSVDMVPAKPKCMVSCCVKSAVIDLAGQDLCLDHFLDNCRERLDKLEPMVCSRLPESEENLAARAFLEECSKRTLFICLRHEYLSNLDRSRLLNILLLAGHLQLQLPRSVVKREGSVSDLSAIFFGKIPAKAGHAEDQKDY